MQALTIYAGPTALKHLHERGLKPEHVRIIPAAAGGPKGLILNSLDKFIFSNWLPQSHHTVHLLGASIGAWRMAAAMLKKPQEAFKRLAHDYIRQNYETPPGRKGPTAEHVSEKFSESLEAFFGGHEQTLLNHARYRLHIVTSRGRHVLNKESSWRTPAGYFGAFITNVVQRKAMGAWLERVIFSDRREGLPINLQDYRTRVVHLSEKNFAPALQASCSIPFVLRAVHDIPGAPRGAYWDGGITDYHLHLNYRSLQQTDDARLVLYPHFQKQVVPGWLDKSLKWRHKSSAYLDNLIVLAPTAEWVKTLPNHKLPDRTDFTTYHTDFSARVKAWSQATSQAQQLADEFAHLLDKQDWNSVKPL
jgi:hypothetical protein